MCKRNLLSILISAVLSLSWCYGINAQVNTKFMGAYSDEDGTTEKDTGQLDISPIENSVAGACDFSDNFNDGNANGWQPNVSSRWSVVLEGSNDYSYCVVAASPEGVDEYTLLPTRYGDFNFEVSAKSTGPANKGYFLLFDVVDFTNSPEDSYYLKFLPGGVQLFYSVGGSGAIIATHSGDFVSDGNYHRIRVQRDFPYIRVWADGQSLIDISDTTLISGYVGFGLRENTGCFDDFTIIDLNNCNTDISVFPTSHNYGNVPSCQDFLVTNTGIASLSVNASLTGTDANQFNIASGGGTFSLSLGQSRTVSVCFVPNSSGSKSAILRLTSNDPDENPLNVPLTGIGPDSSLFPEISVTPKPFNYGNVIVGDSKHQIFVVKNLGQGDLLVTGVDITGTDASQFTISSGGGSFSLAPNGIREVDVRFGPTSMGSKSAALRFISNDPDSNVYHVQLSGTGTGVPDIDVIPPTSYDYGNVIAGSSKSQTFVVRNAGTAFLSVTGVSLTGTDANQFLITSGGGSFTLAPDSTQDVSVRFGPTSMGLKRAALQFSSNDLDSNLYHVQLSGTGTGIPDIDVTPNPYTFGNVPVGSSQSQVFVVKNEGTAYLSVTEISITGPDANQFLITSGGAPFTRSPNDSQIVNVRFGPTSSGSKNAVLRFKSNDPDENPYDVTLSGNVGTPDISVAPNLYNYGDVVVGSSKSQIFVVKNEGADSLSVTSVNLTGTDGSQFYIDIGGSPFTLAPNETQNIHVRFSPGSVGSKSGNVRFISNDPDENPYYVSLSGNGVTPDISVTPNPYNYGDVVVGSSKSQVFLVKNEGTANLSVTSVSVTGTDESQFVITTGGGSFTLLPNQTSNVVVRFGPTSIGSKSAVLRFRSNDPDEDPYDVPLIGTGVGVPDISVIPDTHNYGDVQVSFSSSRSFRVTNSGTASLTVTSVTLIGTDTNQYSITSGGGSFTLPVGQSHNIVVDFGPTSTGPKSALLRISSNDPDENPFDVPLSGIGVIRKFFLTPNQYDYGEVPVGSSKSQTFVAMNAGTADILVTGVSLTGNDANQYAIASGGGSFTLAPDQSRDVTVNFNPESDGSKNAALRFASADLDGGQLDVPLSGTGVINKISVNPRPHHYGDVLLGSSKSQPFVVTNTGTASLTVTGVSLIGTDAIQYAITSGGGSFTLAPSLSREVAVDFIPSSVGLKNTTLRFASDDLPDERFDVPLSGTCVVDSNGLTVAPIPYDFGDVLVGSSKFQTFVVTNESMANISVTGVSVAGTDESQFVITTGGGSFTLLPNQTHNVDVRFSPISIGSKNANLRLTTNDPDENPYDVQLNGTGVDDPLLQLSSTTVEFGSSKSDLQFTISNAGTGTLSWSATANQSWITFVNPASDNTVNGSPANVSVSVSRTGLGVGTHDGTITVNSNGGDGTITVRVIVVPETIPVDRTFVFANKDKRSDYKSSEYQIIGLPGRCDCSLSSILTGEPGKNWQVYWDNGAAAKYLEEYDGTDKFNLAAGRAFWVVNKGNIEVKKDLDFPTLNETDEAEITLHSGWNLITNPFKDPIEWSVIKSVNGISQPYWHYNGNAGFSSSALSSSSALEPYKGYYLKNSENLAVLRIPYRPDASAPLEKNNGLSWRVDISLKSGGFSDESAFLAVSADARTDQDEFDYYKPRSVGNYPQVYFLRPEWDAEDSYFATDVRPEVHGSETWVFSVASTRGTGASLAFSNLETVPAEFDIYLVDLRLGVKTDLRQRPEYRFVPSSEVTSFEVLVGNPDALQEKLDSILPTEFALSQNYPNPFNPGTKISYSIPQPGFVSLVVYDCLGRTIRTLVHEQQESNTYSVIFDATGLASGVYFYTLEVEGNQKAVKKMLLLR